MTALPAIQLVGRTQSAGNTVSMVRNPGDAHLYNVATNTPEGGTSYLPATVGAGHRCF